MFGIDSAQEQTRDGAPTGLAEETVNAFSWLARIVTVFWRVQSRVTILVIGATVLHAGLG